MKKDNLKIFVVCFVVVYLLIAGLSVINNQPLVFTSGYRYSLDQFIVLFVLLGALSFALVLVMETLEKLLKKFLMPIFSSPFSIYVYFILMSFLGLFIFSLISGFAESGRALFYYRCVTNSCIYLFSGYTVTLMMAVYFSCRFVKALSVKVEL